MCFPAGQVPCLSRLLSLALLGSLWYHSPVRLPIFDSTTCKQWYINLHWPSKSPGKHTAEGLVDAHYLSIRKNRACWCQCVHVHVYVRTCAYRHACRIFFDVGSRYHASLYIILFVFTVQAVTWHSRDDWAGLKYSSLVRVKEMFLKTLVWFTPSIAGLSSSRHHGISLRRENLPCWPCALWDIRKWTQNWEWRADILLISWFIHIYTGTMLFRCLIPTNWGGTCQWTNKCVDQSTGGATPSLQPGWFVTEEPHRSQSDLQGAKGRASGSSSDVSHTQPSSCFLILSCGHCHVFCLFLNKSAVGNTWSRMKVAEVPG